MTAQIPDTIYCDGEELDLLCSPEVADGAPRVVSVPDGHLGHTACYRGYVATWAVRDEQLYLLAVEGNYEMDSDVPLFAKWVSGILRIGAGDVKRYRHGGFETRYETEHFLEIERGVVLRTHTVSEGDPEYPNMGICSECGIIHVPGNESQRARCHAARWRRLLGGS